MAPPVLVAIVAILLVQTCQTSAHAQAKPATESGTTVDRTLSEIRDKAKVFDADSITSAREKLKRIERETKIPIVIATIETLNRESIDEAADRLARELGFPGIFTLIARKEHRVEIVATMKYQSALTKKRREAIRAAFIAGFRHQDFDEGLRLGVSAIGEELADAARAGEMRKPVPAAKAFGLTTAYPPPEPKTPPLVVRNQVKLTLDGARAILAGAEAKAAELKLKVNIAVVDDGGHLLAFERLDEARPASIYTAITKATSAATYRQPTGPFPPGSSTPDLLLSLSLQNAAQASGGKLTTLYGGVPVVVENQVIGGVGVGGGTGEQDAQVARAGIQSLLDHLAAGQPATKTIEAEAAEKTK